MASPARDFKIVYGSLTLGTDSSPDMPIDGRIITRKSYEEFECEFSFIVFGSTPANFKSRCDTVEDELRTPYQDLVITVGDTSTNAIWYSLKQSDGTGYGHRPEISKRADTEHDSGLSRRYTAKIIVQLPADQLGTTNNRMGRRDSVVQIDTEANGIRTVKISGVFTGVPSGSGDIHARDQHDTQISAYCLAVLTALDSTADFHQTLSSSNTEDLFDDTSNIGKGGILEFTREYREIIFQEGEGITAGTLDDPLITSQNLSATRHRFNQELGVNDPTALDYSSVTYSCVVDKSITGVALRDKYDDDIRPFIVAQVRSILPIYSTAIVQDDVQFNFDENTITTTMQIGGIQSGNQVEGELTVEDSLETGQILVPFWSESDTHSKFQYQGPAKRTRTISARQRFLSRVDGRNPLEADSFRNPENGVVISKTVRTIPIRVSADFRTSQPSFTFFDRETTIVIEYFTPLDSTREIGQDMDEALDDLAPESPGGPGLG